MPILRIGDQDVPYDDDSQVVGATVREYQAVELTGHAIRQMEIRDISRDQVLDAMRHPDATGLPTEPGRLRFRRHKTARVSIDVVFEEMKTHIRVITAIKISRRIARRRQPMKDLNFQIKVSVDKSTGVVVAVYFQIREGKATKVTELADGKAFANYGTTGKLLGIELLAPCEVTVLDQLVKKEPKVIKNFLLRTAPPEMLTKAG